MSTYNYTFKSVVFESVKVKSVKKNSQQPLDGPKKIVRRFENDTFESVCFKSVEIESVVVSAHPLVLSFISWNGSKKDENYLDTMHTRPIHSKIKSQKDWGRRTITEMSKNPSLIVSFFSPQKGAQQLPFPKNNRNISKNNLVGYFKEEFL